MNLKDMAEYREMINEKVNDLEKKDETLHAKIFNINQKIVCKKYM